jgi:hypothetical protein
MLTALTKTMSVLNMVASHNKAQGGLPLTRTDSTY